MFIVVQIIYLGNYYVSALISPNKMVSFWRLPLGEHFSGLDTICRHLKMRRDIYLHGLIIIILQFQLKCGIHNHFQMSFDFWRSSCDPILAARCHLGVQTSTLGTPDVDHDTWVMDQYTVDNYTSLPEQIPYLTSAMSMSIWLIGFT